MRNTIMFNVDYIEKLTFNQIKAMSVATTLGRGII